MQNTGSSRLQNNRGSAKLRTEGSATPEMVERVATAIGKLRFSLVMAATNGGDEGAGHALARTAIEAMREPTDAMLDAGVDCADGCTDGWTASAPCIAEHLWAEMMNVALGISSAFEPQPRDPQVPQPIREEP